MSPLPAMADFTGTPLPAVGTVRGVRSFAWDADGRLYAPVYGTEWVVGENVAECMKNRGPAQFARATASVRTFVINYGAQFTGAAQAAADAVKRADWVLDGDSAWWPEGARLTGSMMISARQFGPLPGWYGPDGRPDGPLEQATRYGRGGPGGYGPEAHDPHDCRCGFYAYSQDSHSYPGYSDVVAAVEGWGHVTVGARGFRAQRAAVVALALRSARTSPSYSATWQRQEDEWAAARDAIAARWPVPVFASAQAMAREFPVDLLDDLRP